MGPDRGGGRHGRCEVFADFLRPVLRDSTESVTYLTETDVAESASRLSDITFRTCLADREGPAELVARGLAALWFERELTRLAGALPHDLESGETALAAVARRGTDPRAEANASAVVVRILLEAGTLHQRCATEARRTVLLWQNLAAGPTSRKAPGTGTAEHDLQRLCDAASHLGLAAARFGDRRRPRRRRNCPPGCRDRPWPRPVEDRACGQQPRRTGRRDGTRAARRT